MVPKEASIGNTRADRYYRLEMKNYESVAYNTVFYGNGTSIVVKALFESRGEIVRIYEYETLEMLIDDLREEVSITFSCIYKPRYRKPIAEVEI